MTDTEPMAEQSEPPELEFDAGPLPTFLKVASWAFIVPTGLYAFQGLVAAGDVYTEALAGGLLISAAQFAATALSIYALAVLVERLGQIVWVSSSAGQRQKFFGRKSLPAL